jgi:ABC-type nitrate/sulfonate/bicarbonate transport system substrate-binding protein
MSRTRILKRRDPIRIGFLPLSDCAPLVYAHEAGLFEKYEVDVELQRERRWADLRDKVVHGELDAAHAPVTLPFLSNIGMESDPCACVSGLVLSLQGNAITLSRQLWDQGVRGAPDLRDRVFEHWGRRTFTFAVPFPMSTQYILLRQWLASGGLMPESQVRIVIVPPEQMFPTLKLGYIDGYCVGEPWASVAADAGVGVPVATSAELAPWHPEKVLMVRQSFAQGSAAEHERVIAALLDACSFCDQPGNQKIVRTMLAEPRYVNAPLDCFNETAEQISNLSQAVPPVSGHASFHRHQANDPSDDKAAWVMDHLSELIAQSSFRPAEMGRSPTLTNVFRRDIYLRARKLVAEQASVVRTLAEEFQAKAMNG